MKATRRARSRTIAPARVRAIRRACSRTIAPARVRAIRRACSRTVDPAGPRTIRPARVRAIRRTIDPARVRTVRAAPLACAALACCACLVMLPASARAAVGSSTPDPAGASEFAAGGGSGSETGGSSLEAAASKAGSTGRKVAMSLIGLAFAVTGIVLAFRRDFKEAAGVFAVGIVAVLLATPAGINLLQDTVNSLFGS
jgi:hypothetical protein